MRFGAAYIGGGGALASCVRPSKILGSVRYGEDDGAGGAGGGLARRRSFSARRRAISVANNYASSLTAQKRFKEAKTLFRKVIPVARRVLGEDHDITLNMRTTYSCTLFRDPGATLDDLREAVPTLEDTARIRRRVLGGNHPVTTGIEDNLRYARAVLRARETLPQNAVDAPS